MDLPQLLCFNTLVVNLTLKSYTTVDEGIDLTALET